MSLVAGPGASQPPGRRTGEPARRFAERVFGLAPNAWESHVTETRWNGRPTIFVDFVRGEEREIFALQRQPGGTYRRLHVTTGEVEGATPQVAAIGFANADRDAARELIVILTWQVLHYDVEGTLYEVRILDDPAPRRAALEPLPSASRLFEANACDCDRRDGTHERFRFKSIAAVQRELRRAGY